MGEAIIMLECEVSTTTTATTTAAAAAATTTTTTAAASAVSIDREQQGTILFY